MQPKPTPSRDFFAHRTSVVIAIILIIAPIARPEDESPDDGGA